MQLTKESASGHAIIGGTPAWKGLKPSTLQPCRVEVIRFLMNGDQPIDESSLCGAIPGN
jgi:hypothetical protein